MSALENIPGLHAAESARSLVWNALFCDKTNLIYDCLTTFEPDGNICDLPTSEEIALMIPNGSGWGTSMEDSMISAGLMTDAELFRYILLGDSGSKEKLSLLLSGIRLCERVGEKGFLARSVHPYDKKSFYPNSSRDQYTHVVYSVSKALRNSAYSGADKDTAVSIITEIAERTRRNVTAENDYEMLRNDGKPGMVEKMWNCDPHEWLRLPMIYLAAYEANGDSKWLEAYRALRDEGIKHSFELPKEHYRMYPISQMQLSIRLLWEYETDEEYRKKYAELLMFVESKTRTRLRDIMNYYDSNPEIRFDLLAKPWRSLSFTYTMNAPVSGFGYFTPFQPNSYHEDNFCLLADAANAVIIKALCPEYSVSKEDEQTFAKIIERVDFSRHASRAATYISAAYWTAEYYKNHKE